MKKHSVLCLTDHFTHSSNNSLYALVNAMLKHKMFSDVYIASRSNDRNHRFFEGVQMNEIHAFHVVENVTFESCKEDLNFKTKAINPRYIDILFLRLPQPTTNAFLRKLEVEFKHNYIVNRPSGIIKCGSKEILLNFPNVCPPTKLCHSVKDILDFSEQYDLVLKPLRAYGGKGILRITKGILNDGKKSYSAEQYLQTITNSIEHEGYIAMQYLKNVHMGDKRLIVVDGEILAASLRMPAEGSWLCNVALGGESLPSQADQDEIEIVKQISPFLKENGILIYGVDTLVNDDEKRVLSEINVLSIGGFPQAEAQTGKPIITKTLDKIISYAGLYEK